MSAFWAELASGFVLSGANSEGPCETRLSLRYSHVCGKNHTLMGWFM